MKKKKSNLGWEKIVFPRHIQYHTYHIQNVMAKKFRIPVGKLKPIEKKKTLVEHPKLHGKMIIDTKEFKIGFLKIAYEFGVDSLPDYFSDKTAIDISRVLKQADYNSVEKYVNIGNGFDHALFDPLSTYVDLDSKKHFLVLASSEDVGLFCFIHLYGIFSIGVTLSEKQYPSDLMVFGVNDIDKKTFRKVRAEQLIPELYSPPELRFQYYFPSERDMRDFIELQSDCDFDFHMENGEIPLFDNKGSVTNCSLFEKLKEVENTVVFEEMKNGRITYTFTMDDDVYIQIIPSGKLVKIIAVRQEFQQVSKFTSVPTFYRINSTGYA